MKLIRNLSKKIDIVISGQKYVLSHFLEKVSGNITSEKCKLTEDKTTIFFHESIYCLSFCEL